jgi:hypothetical protein
MGSDCISVISLEATSIIFLMRLIFNSVHQGKDKQPLMM